MSPVLAPSVDLALVAGLGRQAVLVVSFRKLAREAGAAHAVTERKQEDSLDVVRHLPDHVRRVALTPVRLCRTRRGSRTGSLRQCWNSHRCRGCRLRCTRSHPGNRQRPGRSRIQKDKRT